MIHVWVCLNIPKNTVDFMAREVLYGVYWIFLLIEIMQRRADEILGRF